MGWNFRKRKKVGSGLFLNLSKGGISTSVGIRGAKLNFNKNGVYLNLGIPGTGLYTRTKLGGNSKIKNKSNTENNMEKSNNNSDSGCVWGILIISIAVALYALFESNLDSGTKGKYIVFVIVCSLIFSVLFLWLCSGSGIQESILKNRYDYFLNRYKEDERRVLIEIDSKVSEAQSVLSKETDERKRLFLQSFIDCFRNVRLNVLFSMYHFYLHDVGDNLHPRFWDVADEIIKSGKDKIDLVFIYNYLLGDYDTSHVIVMQMIECGFLINRLDEHEYEVCVNTQSELVKIKKLFNGKSRLTNDDKNKLNSFFEGRKKELVGDGAEFTNLSCEISKEYSGVLSAYDALCKCGKKWVYASKKVVTEYKCGVKTSVTRFSAGYMNRESFNYVALRKDVNVPCFNFIDRDLTLYLYPEYVVVAYKDSLDFEIVDIKDFDIEFEKSNFQEDMNATIPKDAKFVRYMYKYMNKNGERDMRYSDNPQYSVYEYGELTFLPYDLTMAFSNSEVAEAFYNAFQHFKNDNKLSESSVPAISELLFDKISTVAEQLTDFYDKLLNDKRF